VASQQDDWRLRDDKLKVKICAAQMNIVSLSKLNLRNFDGCEREFGEGGAFDQACGGWRK